MILRLRARRPDTHAVYYIFYYLLDHPSLFQQARERDQPFTSAFKLSQLIPAPPWFSDMPALPLLAGLYSPEHSLISRSPPLYSSFRFPGEEELELGGYKGTKKLIEIKPLCRSGIVFTFVCS
ncbi:hypothetical protein LTR97_012115 [Elasticomyces elasticus]|uniref:Uncharacterized protein n=1 Tax=Elasticomyces elasticus TaxID=574655 RepID=A0AAN7ZY84_9PEZI|nr:hypothetical protein LTR97_012115 [Elasticomyces elasticus]